MITEDTRDADVEYSDGNLEVRVVIRVVETREVATGRILDATQMVLAGALTTLGMPGVEASLAAWHESRAVEAREEGDF